LKVSEWACVISSRRIILFYIFCFCTWWCLLLFAETCSCLHNRCNRSCAFTGYISLMMYSINIMGLPHLKLKCAF